MSETESIGIIGAGLMGSGIAQVFIQKNHPVWLIDIEERALEESLTKIRSSLKKFEEHGLPLEQTPDEALALITTGTDMSEYASEWDFVIECVFEKLELKQKVFAELDQLCKSSAILCSNTSVISITEIASESKHRERIVGTHFWNPPYLIPLVEVVRAEETADWCIAATYDLMARVGKHPVHVHKDAPGFVGNRLQHALWREAFAIIDEGICDPATVDEVVRNGFGLRLPILGPVENADMVGLDLTLAIHNYILKYINADPTPSTTLQAKVEAGELGFKSRKGFLEWSEADITESRQRLANYLITAIAEKQ